jgi:EcsC family protein
VTTAVAPVRSGIASAVHRVADMAHIIACVCDIWVMPSPVVAAGILGTVSKRVLPHNKATEAVVNHLLRAGIDGGGRLASASRSAERALAATSDTEEAIDRIVAHHCRLAAAGGFATGLGGFVTMPVALPVNVLGFYVIATRMVAAIAAVRGHDVGDDAVRTSVLLTLTGSDASKVVGPAGIGVDGVAAYALRSVSPAALMVVNKAVAFRLFVQLGRHGVARFGRVVPVVGGLVGAAFDTLLMRRIAHHARQHFPLEGAPPTQWGGRRDAAE